MQPFPNIQFPSGKLCKTMEESLPANKPKRNKGGRGVFSGGTPTTDNLIAFKRAKKSVSLAEYVVNARENLDPVCVFNHIVNLPVNSCGERSKQRTAFIGFKHSDIIGNFYCLVFVTFLAVGSDLIGVKHLLV
ncbi:hypothetical protein TNCV_4689571 [Trichonephila clavipes]|nr:hypothetical protein TNCV_4689571 [Trichonephila clavipes]